MSTVYGEEQMPTEESTALQRIDNPPPAIRQDVEMVREITPAQARVESVALVLNSAYQNASKLHLTPEEAKALMADFDDSDIRSGARGDQNLIYLEHAAVRRRLMEVFGPGQWTIINRRSWLDESAGWLYADTVLVCRGCFVGECIGAMRYSPKNSRTNYADAVKGAESDALGRIAGTALGVGLKLWSKEFCDGWHQRQNAARNAPRHRTTPPPQPAPKPAPQANQDKREWATPPAGWTPPQTSSQANQRQTASASDVLPPVATEARKQKVVDYLVKMFGGDQLDEFFVSKGWKEAWDLKHVPASNQDLSRLVQEINDFIAARQAPPTDAPPSEGSELPEDDLPSDWADVIFSIAPKGTKKQEWLDRGVTLGQMYRGSAEDKKRLFAFAKGDWRPEPWIDSSGAKRPPSQEDVDCRIALDLFLDWRSNRGEHDES